VAGTEVRTTCCRVRLRHAAGLPALVPELELDFGDTEDFIADISDQFVMAPQETLLSWPHGDLDVDTLPLPLSVTLAEPSPAPWA
jgi:hypothetical protein